MSRHVPLQLRRTVIHRALKHCEYCLSFQDYSLATFQIEHIISLKHGGKTELENLCLSCVFCNRNKGADVGTVLLPDDEFIRFFNPRKHRWSEHFELSEALILPKTKIGESTLKILDFNAVDRLLERSALLELGLFPHPDVLGII